MKDFLSLLLSSASVSSPEASAKVFSGSVDFSDLLPDFSSDSFTSSGLSELPPFWLIGLKTFS